MVLGRELNYLLVSFILLGFALPVAAQNEPNTPQTQVALPDSWVNEPVQVILVCEATQGCQATFYQIDDGNWQQYTGPFTIESEGKHKLAFYSIDAANNIEPTQIKEVLIDLTPPSEVSNLRTTVSDQGILVQWDQARDNLSGIGIYEIYRDGNLVGTTINEVYFDAGIEPTQVNQYGVVAVDVAGNKSRMATVIVQPTPVQPTPTPARPQGPTPTPAPSVPSKTESTYREKLLTVFEQASNLPSGGGISLVADVNTAVEGQAVTFTVSAKTQPNPYIYYKWSVDGKVIVGENLTSLKYPFYLPTGEERTVAVKVEATDGVSVYDFDIVNIHVTKAYAKITLLKPLLDPDRPVKKEGSLALEFLIVDQQNQAVDVSRIRNISAKFGDTPAVVKKGQLQPNSFVANVSLMPIHRSPVEYLYVTVSYQDVGKVRNLETYLPVYLEPIRFKVTNVFSDNRYCVGQTIGGLTILAKAGKMPVSFSNARVVVKTFTETKATFSISNRGYVDVNWTITAEDLLNGLHLEIEGVDAYGNIPAKNSFFIPMMDYVYLEGMKEKIKATYGQELVLKPRVNEELAEAILDLQATITSQQLEVEKSIEFDELWNATPVTVKMPSSRAVKNVDLWFSATTYTASGICQTITRYTVELTNELSVAMIKPASGKNDFDPEAQIVVRVQYPNSGQAFDGNELEAVVLIDGNEHKVKLSKQEAGVFVGKLDEPIEPGEHTLKIKLVGGYVGESEEYKVSIRAPFDIWQILLPFIFIMVFLIVLVKLLTKSTEIRETREELIERQHALKKEIAKAKEQFESRKITKAEYNKIIATKLKELEAVNEKLMLVKAKSQNVGAKSLKVAYKGTTHITKGAAAVGVATATVSRRLGSALKSKVSSITQSIKKTLEEAKQEAERELEKKKSEQTSQQQQQDSAVPSSSPQQIPPQQATPQQEASKPGTVPATPPQQLQQAPIVEHTARTTPPPSPSRVESQPQPQQITTPKPTPMAPHEIKRVVTEPKTPLAKETAKHEKRIEEVIEQLMEEDLDELEVEEVPSKAKMTEEEKKEVVDELKVPDLEAKEELDELFKKKLEKWKDEL
jgi:uncharacterized membrane protein